MTTLPLADIDLGQFNKGNTDRIQFTITKDGVAWNLSNAVVTATFKGPDRVPGPPTTFTVNMTKNTDGSDGVYYYQTLTTDLTVAGWWTMGVQVTDNSASPPIIKKWPYQIGLKVNDEPY